MLRMLAPLASLSLGLAAAPVAAAIPSSGGEDSSYDIEPLESDTALDAVPTYLAANARQGLLAVFQPDRVRIVPAGLAPPAWAVDLRVRAFGFEGAQAAPGEVELAASGERIEYRRGPLVEWYVNAPCGIEQGFVLHERPGEVSDAPLVIELEIGGALTARVDADGRSLQLVDAAGDTVLHYSGLLAWDATGRPLDAVLTEIEGGVAIRVDEMRAVYPLTVDPTVTREVAKLTASDAFAVDYFGTSVALWEDTALIGAPRDDDHGQQSGSVYLYGRDVGGRDAWGELKKLTAATVNSYDEFGRAVAMFDDVFVAGAHGDDVNGVDSGSAFVFHRDHGGPQSWGEWTRLLASDGAVGDQFGIAVATRGDTIVVGAHRDGDHGTYSGSAYVFQRDAGGVDNWDQVRKLTAPDGAPFARFGSAVATSGETAVVGADGHDHGGVDAGAVYVFQRDAGGADNWGFVARILSPDAAFEERFGLSVAIWEDTIAVGALTDREGALNAGAVYVFVQDGVMHDEWELEAVLEAPDGETADYFGVSVSLWEDTLLVGTTRGLPDPMLGGAAYQFVRSAGGPEKWELTAKYAEGEDGDQFGSAVSAWEDTAVFGARGDDEQGFAAGAAYVFAVGGEGLAFCFGDGSGTACPCANAGSAGSGCANGSFAAGCRLQARGSANLALDTLFLRSSRSSPKQPGLYLQGDLAVNGRDGVVFGDGLHCVTGRLVELGIGKADALGDACTDFSLSTAGRVGAGDTVLYQYWYRDPTLSPCGANFNLSNAVAVTWGP